MLRYCGMCTASVQRVYLSEMTTPPRLEQSTYLMGIRKLSLRPFPQRQEPMEEYGVRITNSRFEADLVTYKVRHRLRRGSKIGNGGYPGVIGNRIHRPQRP
jgi:hypothetical protein